MYIDRSDGEKKLLMARKVYAPDTVEVYILDFRVSAILALSFNFTVGVSSVG